MLVGTFIIETHSKGNNSKTICERTPCRQLLVNSFLVIVCIIVVQLASWYHQVIFCFNKLICFSFECSYSLDKIFLALDVVTNRKICIIRNILIYNVPRILVCDVGRGCLYRYLNVRCVYTII